MHVDFSDGHLFSTLSHRNMALAAMGSELRTVRLMHYYAAVTSRCIPLITVSAVCNRVISRYKLTVCRKALRHIGTIVFLGSEAASNVPVST